MGRHKILILNSKMMLFRQLVVNAKCHHFLFRNLISALYFGITLSVNGLEHAKRLSTQVRMRAVKSAFLTFIRKALMVKLVNVLVEPQDVLRCKGSISRSNAIQVAQRQPRPCQRSKL